MKTGLVFIVSLVFALIFASLIPAEGWSAPTNYTGSLGVGVMVGDTASVTGKYWASQRSALDLTFGVADVGGGYGRESMVQLSYLQHFGSAFSNADSRFASELSPYIGAGIGLGFNLYIDDERRDTDTYVRLPLGLAWIPKLTPIDVFLEIAPTGGLDTTGAGFYLSGNIGGHYYF